MWIQFIKSSQKKNLNALKTLSEFYIIQGSDR